LDVFDAIARGFLRTSRTILEEEVQLMVDAARVLALELGVRFLTDYLRGDTYVRLSRTDPPDLNRVRAVGQLTLFRRLHSETEALRRSIERWWRP
ncbi:MAG: mucin desulfatase, partial [Acidobacteriota bacterium]